MIYVIIGMGLFFIMLGFILTSNNAKFLLAGYNTASEEERKNFNIEAYIPFFRRFHFILGSSLIFICVPVYMFLDRDIAGLIMAVYPMLAYVYFIIATRRFYRQVKAKISDKFGLIVLLVCVIGVLILSYFGSKDELLLYNERGIQVSGMYGIDYQWSEIGNLTLGKKVPDISVRLHGFSLSNTQKGIFRTKNREKVRLLLMDQEGPLVILFPKNDLPVYYRSRDFSEEQAEQLITMAKSELVETGKDGSR